MKWVILLSVLAGWLVTEIKDFFNGGALSNPLAITLLKILFICIGILLVAFTLMTSHLLPKAIKRYMPEDLKEYISDDNLSQSSESTVKCNNFRRGRSKSPMRFVRSNSVKRNLTQSTEG
jgi:hypothetical protein